MTYRKNWTPGPWKLIWHGNEKYPYPLSIHTADDTHWIVRYSIVSTKANAHLLANAERLFEALEQIVGAWESPEMRNLWNECVDRLGGYDGPFADMKAARAALLAADGQGDEQ